MIYDPNPPVKTKRYFYKTDEKGNKIFYSVEDPQPIKAPEQPTNLIQNISEPKVEQPITEQIIPPPTQSINNTQPSKLPTLKSPYKYRSIEVKKQMTTNSVRISFRASPEIYNYLITKPKFSKFIRKLILKEMRNESNKPTETEEDYTDEDEY